MRINLITPFAEKDAVKALGARWDGTKKLWYITNVADLTPFARWISDLAAATQGTTDGTARPITNTPKVQPPQSRGVFTKSAVDVPHYGCDVLPWDDCGHTASSWHPRPGAHAHELQNR